MTWIPLRSCSAGETFVVLGLAYVISARWTWIDADGGWVLGTFLVGLGVAGVVGATTATPPSESSADRRGPRGDIQFPTREIGEISQAWRRTAT